MVELDEEHSTAGVQGFKMSNKGWRGLVKVTMEVSGTIVNLACRSIMNAT